LVCYKNDTCGRYIPAGMGSMASGWGALKPGGAGVVHKLCSKVREIYGLPCIQAKSKYCPNFKQRDSGTIQDIVD